MANTEEEKLCVVMGCGRKHKALGLCAPHYLRSRAGQALERPIGAKKVEPEVALATRVSLEAKAVLLALAEAEGVSMYAYLTRILQEHAQHWKGGVDAARLSSHLTKVKRDYKRRERGEKRYTYEREPRGLPG